MSNPQMLAPCRCHSVGSSRRRLGGWAKGPPSAVVAMIWLFGCGARTNLEQDGLTPLLVDAGGIDGGASDELTPLQELVEQGELCIDQDFRFRSGETTVMLVVDQSGSMNDFFVDKSRWETLGDVLFDEGSGLLPTLQESIRFGMMLYTGDMGFASGTCPILQTAEIGFGNVETLRELYENNPPPDLGDTPTGEALAAATAALLQDDVGGEKKIVLITDGEPDTCERPNPQFGHAPAIAAAREAFVAGFEVFTIGLSDDIGNVHLQQMSNVGRGRAFDLVWGVDENAAQPFRAGDNADELAEQLSGAIGHPRTCEFDLSKEVLPAELSTALDNEELEAGVDWVIDGQVLRLVGEACAAVRDSAEGLRVAEIDCDD